MLESVIFTQRSNKTNKVTEIEVSFTDKNVTAGGGMKHMKEMVDSIGIKEVMSGLDPPEKGSNRGYEPMQIIECFWTSIYSQQSKYGLVIKTVQMQKTESKNSNMILAWIVFAWTSFGPQKPSAPS